MGDRELTPLYARALVHLTRPFPNFDFLFVDSLRQKAVQLLHLKPGDRVLDAGCGRGVKFPVPWALLKNHIDALKVEEYFFGWMFLAWGSINAGRG